MIRKIIVYIGLTLLFQHTKRTTPWSINTFRIHEIFLLSHLVNSRDTWRLRADSPKDLSQGRSRLLCGHEDYSFGCGCVVTTNVVILSSGYHFIIRNFRLVCDFDVDYCKPNGNTQISPTEALQLCNIIRKKKKSIQLFWTVWFCGGKKITRSVPI